jgi:hypothetical protein
MREFTHETLLNSDPAAGLDARLSALVACCTQVAREIVEAVEDGIGYFDEGGLRFAVVTDTADLWPGGAVAAFLNITGDPLPEVLDRLEGCHAYADVRAHLLVLSISDTSGDYLLLADECLNSAWTQEMDDRHAVGAPAA